MCTFLQRPSGLTSSFDFFTLLIQQPSSFSQARRIIKSDGIGLKGLNKGLTSTLGRHGVFNMIYFGFYFNVKDAIPTSPVIHQSESMIALWPAVLFRLLLTNANSCQVTSVCNLDYAPVLLPSGYMIRTCPSHFTSGEMGKCLTAWLVSLPAMTGRKQKSERSL